MPYPSISPSTIRFVRHGATAANLAGLRCGGDLDLPLTDVGRAQAQDAAWRIAELQPPIGLVVTSDLLRTRETAAIIAETLGGLRVVVEPGLAERHLGEWNLRPIAETQPWFDAHCTPPGGESEEQFIERITLAVKQLKPYLPYRPLLVGSKGVARALGLLAGMPGRFDLGNAGLAHFDLSAQPRLETTWGTL